MTKKPRKPSIPAGVDSALISHAGRIIAGAYYDFQAIRTASMNRVRDLIRKKAEGIPFDEVEEEKEEKTFDKRYADAQLPERLLEIQDQLTQKEYDYLKKTLEAAREISKMEQRYERMMPMFVEGEPVYQRFLKEIIGIGPVLSANLIKEFGHCEQYEHSSSLWKHCGLDVQNGASPRRRKGEKLYYDPKLKTLAWKIAASFRQMKTPVYRDMYDAEKEEQRRRMEHSVCRFCGKRTDGHYRKPKSNEYYCTEDMDQQVFLKDFDIVDTVPLNATPPWSGLHIEYRALRKAVKLFLEHYWVASRKVTGQPTESPWIIEHGKHSDYIDFEEAIRRNREDKKKRRANRENKKAVKKQLLETPEWSDECIASHVGVDVEMVQDFRKKLEDKGEIPRI